MGRNTSDELSYFKINITQGDNLDFVEAKHGIVGYGVVVKLWRKIYSSGGYYCDFKEKNTYLFSKDIGVPVTDVMNILETCFSGEAGEQIFDKHMYAKHSILTSLGVQKFWLQVVTDAKRKNRIIDEKYDLLGTNQAEIAFPPEDNAKTLEQNTQSKVKESKVNESNDGSVDGLNSKVSVGATALPSAPKKKAKKKTAEKFIAPELQQVKDYFVLKMGNAKKNAAWALDRCHNEAEKLFDHYKANGWKQGRGKPIVDWKAACRNWMRNAIEGTFEKPQPKSQQAVVKQLPPKQPQLSKQQEEINYFYGMYLEGKCTHISISEVDWNFVNAVSPINFSDEEKTAVRKAAQDYMTENQLKPAELGKFMKRFGVIEYFNQQKKSGKKTIFNENEARATG